MSTYDYCSSIKTRRITKGKLEGRQQGIQEGMQKGKIEAQLEIAKQMLMTGMARKSVMKFIGLTDNQIRHLLKS